MTLKAELKFRRQNITNTTAIGISSNKFFRCVGQTQKVLSSFAISDLGGWVDGRTTKHSANNSFTLSAVRLLLSHSDPHEEYSIPSLGLMYPHATRALSVPANWDSALIFSPSLCANCCGCGLRTEGGYKYVSNILMGPPENRPFDLMVTPHIAVYLIRNHHVWTSWAADKERGQWWCSAGLFGLSSRLLKRDNIIW